MEALAPPDFEELLLCSCCKQKYNDAERSPKLLSCKHYFCLQCVRAALANSQKAAAATAAAAQGGPGSAGGNGQGGGGVGSAAPPQELYCVHCWKRTELPAAEPAPEALPTYVPVLCLVKNFAQLKLNPNAPQQAAGIPKPPPNKSSVPGQGGPGSQSKVISENCHTHAMPLALWCQTCCAPLCRACASTSEHASHHVKSQNETKDQLAAELQLELQTMQKMFNEIQRLAMQQREFLLKILEACVTLKTHVEADLTNNASQIELTDIRDFLSKERMNLTMAENLGDVRNVYSTINAEKQRMQLRYQEMYLQCQLDDLIRNSTVVFDFQLLKQALANIQNGDIPYPGNQRMITSQQNPILFLANYCMSQLYSHVISKHSNGNVDYHQPAQVHNHHTAGPPALPPAPLPPQPLHQQQNFHHSVIGQAPQPPPHIVMPPSKNLYSGPPSDGLSMMHHHHHHQNMIHSPQMGRNPMQVCPLYYFNIEVNGQPMGRIVIEVRADVAPKMAKNFGLLSTGEVGMGYKGCSIFQCWEGESVITGDFELNNGRGGRSIFEESYFLPDDTKLLAVRGTVGMRRTQKRHDNLGMVGSQFRIILQEMRGFTGIFGHVVEGLELVEKISTYGDTAGKPTKNILIVKCGKL